MRPPPGDYVLPGKQRAFSLVFLASFWNNIYETENMGTQFLQIHNGLNFDHESLIRVCICMCVFVLGGIFLLLGYSSMDEELLRAYTNLGIQDTIRAFQQYIYNHIDNQVCLTYF